MTYREDTYGGVIILYSCNNFYYRILNHHVYLLYTLQQPPHNTVPYCLRQERI